MTVSYWSSILVLTATTLTFAMPGAAMAVSTQIIMERPKGDNDGVGFHVRGKVTAGHEKCLKRRIDLFQDFAPPGPSAADVYLGTTASNANGIWRFSSTSEPARIYARVGPFGPCEADISRTKTVDY